MSTEQSRENRAYYLRNGRCPRCGGKRPLANGRVLCLECQRKHDEDQRARLARWRAEGRCTRCGGETDAEHAQCQSCREYMAPIRRAASKRWRDRMIEAGMCTRCGKTWAEPGRKYCRACLAKHAAETNTPENREKANLRRAERRAAGLCIDCGAPTEGHQRCERCLEMRRDSTRKHAILKRIQREADRARGAI